MNLPLAELVLPSSVVVWQAVLLTFISLLVGILGGFVGLALGTMRLPALLLLGLVAPVAAGTNILISGLSSLTGAVSHLRAGRVDMRIVLVMGVPTFAGAFIGGFGSARVPEYVLVLLAGLFVLWQGIELIRLAGARSRANQAHVFNQSARLSSEFGAGRVMIEGGIGLGVSLLGGAVGLILGTIRLPAMIRILRVHPPIAAGTNLFIGFIMGSVGWIGHAVQGQVDYPLLVLMGSGAMAGSYFGAGLTGRVSLNALITTMGWVLLVAGGLLVWQAFLGWNTV